MDDSQIYDYAIWAMFAFALITVIMVLFITAPYGRHERKGWGPTISNRAGWLLMESPPVLVFLAFYLTGDHAFDLVPLILLGLWQSHYVYRAWIFPLKMNTAGKQIPLLLPLIAISFNTLNAYVNSRWISHYGEYDLSWLTDPRFIIGAIVFFVGMRINRQSDNILLNLRKPGETGYKVPEGGLYRWISSPNYFGEIIEWFGWAIATWSVAGLAFAVYAIANLAPRALSNHQWYKEKFPDYPQERRALIPGVW